MLFSRLMKADSSKEMLLYHALPRDFAECRDSREGNASIHMKCSNTKTKFRIIPVIMNTNNTNNFHLVSSSRGYCEVILLSSRTKFQVL